jgi:Bax protein
MNGSGRGALLSGVALCAAAAGLSVFAWRMVEDAREHALRAPHRGGAMQVELPVLKDSTGALMGSLSAVVVLPDEAMHLADYFHVMGYRLQPVREGAAEVPRIYARRLPADLQNLPRIELKKRIFIRTVLPLILKVNEEVRATRRRLLAMQERAAAGEVPGLVAANWFRRTAAQYGLEGLQSDPKGISELLARVDEVPASLALAQSIQESGWGTSRFARHGNALFGQRTWSDDDPGLQPNGVSEDAEFRVRAYPDLLSGIRSYVRNLNTHPTYADLRAMRAAARGRGERPSGYLLAGALQRYSEEGGAYVRKLRGLIRSNELRALDDATLDPHSVARILALDPNADEVQVSYETGTRN